MLGGLFDTNPGSGALGGMRQENQDRSRQLYGQLAGYQQNYNQAYQGQSSLGRALDQQIRGNAPSVAQTQLYASLEALRRAQDSQAAGATGQNAALSRYGAIQGYGQGAAQTNQQAALLRAQEVHQAEMAKAQLLAQQQAATGQMFGANLQGSVGFGNTAANLGQSAAQIDQMQRQRLQDFYTNLANAGGSALTQGAIR